MEKIFHITSKIDWETALKEGEYKADTLLTDGSIHCSRKDQVIETANRRFRGKSGLVLLSIDEPEVKAPIKYEPPPGKQTIHPHIYGPLNLNAVTEIYPFEPKADGSFALPEKLK